MSSEFYTASSYCHHHHQLQCSAHVKLKRPNQRRQKGSISSLAHKLQQKLWIKERKLSKEAYRHFYWKHIFSTLQKLSIWYLTYILSFNPGVFILREKNGQKVIVFTWWKTTNKLIGEKKSYREICFTLHRCLCWDVDIVRWVFGCQDTHHADAEIDCFFLASYAV